MILSELWRHYEANKQSTLIVGKNGEDRTV
jgi:hypothetical protein